MTVETMSWAFKAPVKGNNKLVLLALADHADDDGICWPGTKGLAKKCSMSRRCLFMCLEALENLDLIARQQRFDDDGRQRSNVYVLLVDKSSRNEGGRVQKLHGGGAEVAPSGVQKLHPLYKEMNPKKESSREPMSSKLDDDCLKNEQELKENAIIVLEFLNKKTDKNYRIARVNLAFIKARLKTATVEDCKAVIAKKIRDWKDDPKMKGYLRPATLFNETKFEQYIGELLSEKQLEDKHARMPTMR